MKCTTSLKQHNSILVSTNLDIRIHEKSLENGIPIYWINEKHSYCLFFSWLEYSISQV